MDLKELYKNEGQAALNHLAEKAGCNPVYLYQCATSRKEPSPRMARRLVRADSRLSIEDIYMNVSDDAA